MKQFFLLFVFLFFLSFVYADCDGCFSNNVCYDYGNVSVNPQTGVHNYCDYLTKSFVQVKTVDASCENDFECSSEYTCLGGKCTANVASFLSAYNLVLSATQNKSFCIESGMFCYNSSLSAPVNSTLLNNTCDSGSRCYSCNSGLNWNLTLSKCIRPICQSIPGCLNLTSLNNASSSDYYCDVGSCFACDSDFDWNSTNQTCQLKECSSSPGCLNQTSLNNGRLVENRFCASGKCFTCNTSNGYKWNSSSKSCVLSSSIVIDPNEWTTIQFSSVDLDLGSEKILRAYNRLQFSFDGRAYYLAVLSLDSANNRMNYRIDPVLNSMYAYSGAENKFDLNSDGKQDISVKLISVGSTGANVKLMAVKDTVIIEKPVNPIEPEPSETPTSSYVMWVIIFVTIIVLIILIIIAILLVSNRKGKEVSQQQASQQSMQSLYYPQSQSNPQFRR